MCHAREVELGGRGLTVGWRSDPDWARTASLLVGGVARGCGFRRRGPCRVCYDQRCYRQRCRAGDRGSTRFWRGCALVDMPELYPSYSEIDQ